MSTLPPLPPQAIPAVPQPPARLNAVDAISPAIERAKALLFRPFRWLRWWRLGLVGLATGETMASGGCNGFDWLNSINQPHTHRFQSAAPHWPGLDLVPLSLIVVLVLLCVMLVLVHLFISSVLRFVLFDSVTRERFLILEGWRRWQSKGAQFFLFQLLYMLIMLAGWAVILGLPALVAWRTGAFSGNSEHAGLLVLGALVLVPLCIVWSLAGSIIFVAAKDFAVPMIALEDATMEAALRRVWSIIRPAKGEFVFYIVMKIVMSIAIGVIMGIMLTVIIIVPAVIAGIVIAAIAAVHSGASAGASAATPGMGLYVLITLLVMVFIVFIFTVLTLIGPPFAAFWQSYVLEFWAARYAPLRDLLYPAPPTMTPEPSSQAPPPLENPPLPA